MNAQTTNEDEFFNPTAASSTHLATLFGTSMTLKQKDDASLIYTAPKQPKGSGQDAQEPATHSTVICSTFIEVFKLSTKSHTSLGKCGLAIIGNQYLKIYEIMVYKSKQEVLTRSKLKSDFVFIIQSNNVATFCDDEKERWSVHFENKKERNKFVKNIENLGGKIVCDNENTNSYDTAIQPPSTVISDSIEKEKCINLPADNFSNQTKANILSRMAKMGHSILPMNVPNKSYDHSDSETDEQGGNRKQLENWKKSETVNRDVVPSEDTKNINNSQLLNMQTPSLSEFVMVNGQVIPITTLHQMLPTLCPNSLHNVHSTPNQLMIGHPQIVTPISDSMHVFIAENRTHNCEMRMNISQISSKLDQLLSNLHQSTPVAVYKTAEKDELKSEILKKGTELEENVKIIQCLQEERRIFQEKIINSDQIINNLKREYENKEQIILEKEQQIAQLKKDKSLLEQQITESPAFQQSYEEAQETINTLRQMIDNQQASLTKSEDVSLANQQNENLIEQLSKNCLQLENQLSDKNLKANLFARKLKHSMNCLYQEIMENFENKNITFQSDHIKQILSQKLKYAAFALIQEFQTDFIDSETITSVQNNDMTSAIS